MEKVLGYSYRHIREVFKEYTGISLASYIKSRKIANAAFEMAYTDKSLTEIAHEFMFNSYDSFARLFKKLIGVTPFTFRNKQNLVFRKFMLTGIYAPQIEGLDSFVFYTDVVADEYKDRRFNKGNDSCILYGVQKIAFSHKECTPFSVALKACLNYIGQKMDYTYIMAVSGAAFRMRWNPNGFDLSCVDIRNIYEDKYESFKRSFQGVGRDYEILKRENSSKQEFIDFIKKEIDVGKPVIALGVVGPPEACVITGYQNNGNTLLGWSWFQDNLEMKKNLKFHDCGYFISEDWWENESTIAVMAIGEKYNIGYSQSEILANGINIFSQEKVGYLAAGQSAYDEWAKAITQDFGSNTIMPVNFRHLMCQGDAQVMLGEGRSYAAEFIDWIGRTNKEISDKCQRTSMLLRLAAECSQKMNDLRVGSWHNEETLRKFSDKGVRQQIADLILEAKEHEKNACNLMREILRRL
jgi:hypothetical protein